jgi:hypothetical protein
VIDPVALVVLSHDAVVTTLDRNAAAGRVAIHEFGRVDTRTVRVRTNRGDVYLRRADIECIVDLRTDAHRPPQLEYFLN